LPFGVKDPYVPWKIRIPLSGLQVKIITGKTPEENVIFQTPRIKATFTRKGNMLIIQRPGFIQNSQAGALYKLPVDTVFYDRNNRIVKIKNYMLFYGVINGNQKGNHLFTNRVYAKQYKYAADGKMAEFELVRYCDRLKAYESNKVCSIITYTISRQGNSWLLTRKNNPVNSYSDGTFTFVMDDNKNITSISFANEAKTEKWQRNIEMNKDGFVNCYIDKSNDLIRQSLCMIYHNEPGAKVAVETITTIFEKDGISYFQRNNTTGKIRTRDKMTLKWTPWHNEN
jgi:hypothetical protein